MRVSVIICTVNRAEHLRPTLASVAALTVPADWSVELILVDNGSTDDTLSVMHAFTHPAMTVQILQEPAPGKSNALNRAIEAANGEVLLFTDDDVRVPPQWISGMCMPILSGAADAVAGGVKLAPGAQADWMTPQHRSLLASTECISAQAPEHLVGANMAVGRHVFDRIPRFDTELGGGQLGNAEDTLFGWQMREAGFTIVSAFDVVVEHHPDRSRLSRGSFCRMAENRGRSEAYVNYHWRNNTGWSVASLIAGIVVRGAKLTWWRLRHWRTIRNGDHLSMEEFDLVRRFYRVRQHWIERGRDPKYTPYGLIERSVQEIKEPDPYAGTPCETAAS